MGQGRRALPLFRCIVLIVATIQGIMPDSRNLASPLVISLVDPSLIGPGALFDDDHSTEDACEAIQESRPWRAAHLELESRLGYSRPDGRASDQFLPIIGTNSSMTDERPPSQDLPLTLCRLVC